MTNTHDVLQKLYNQIAALNATEKLSQRELGAVKSSLSKIENAPKLLSTLAVESYQSGAFHRAVLYIDAACQLNPNQCVLNAQACEMYRAAGNLEFAERAAKRALSIESNNINALYNYAVVLCEMGRDSEAIEIFQKVLNLNPKHALANYNLGVCFEEQGKIEDAESFLKRAVEITPENPLFIKQTAKLLFNQSKTEQAGNYYRELIKLQPGNVDAHYAYSVVNRYSRQDPTLPALFQVGQHASQFPLAEQIKICYTIGKANQDIGDYPAAFSAYSAGAQRHAKAHPFDEKSHFSMLEDIKCSFNRKFLDNCPVSGVDDSSPIFVLGMPRSGSTLVEKILAAHPEVNGAGELKYLKSTIQNELIDDSGTVGQSISNWQASDLKRASHCYLNQLRTHANGASKVVDKMPGNYAFIGVIKLLFPNAKIIHTVRHPMATIWSNFSTLFGDELNYTYDLSLLARYYRGYQSLMEHWKSVLGENAIFDIQYERLVENPETEISAMLGYIGLDWSDSCIDFYRNTGPVKTASIAQVNRPIYRGSLDQWKNYQNELSSISKLI